MINLIKIPGVMTREMIKDYNGEKVYAPAEELRKGVERTDMIPIYMERKHEHPPPRADPTLDPLELLDDEIIGWGLLWFEDGKVKTNLLFDPQKMTDEQLVMLANLEKDNLSPGFRAIPILESGSFQGQPYTTKQTDFEFKHIAIVTQGRCSALHGCGLYKDHFDGLETPVKDKITRCVEMLTAKGHQPEAAKEICMAAYKDHTPYHPETVNVTGLYYGGGYNNMDQNYYVEVNSVPITECMQKKMDEGMSEADARKACEGTTDAVIAQLKAQLDAQAKELEGFKEKERQAKVDAVHSKLGIPRDQLKQKSDEVLEALLEFEIKPGQPITDATPGTPPKTEETDTAEDEEDPEYKPGLRKTITMQYQTDASGHVKSLKGTPVRVLVDPTTLKQEVIDHG